MTVDLLEKFIEVYNELEEDQSKHVNIEEVMANTYSPDDEYRIEQFIGFVISKIESWSR